jgi:asparagine synthase (glutamine-hydrolysing)
MCGIVADHHPGSETNAHSLTAALHGLRHRGPDGQGIWISPDRQVALGHVRLAIIDPLRSPQPIVSEDGRLCLVVNGEFYDHETIRRDLVRLGHTFRTGGDSEIALHLYEEYGFPSFLDHLRGEFSLVLWDGRRRCLLAARDRFGIKPLCYHHAAGRLLLASETKALFTLGVPAAWDEDAFFSVCGMQYAPPHRTLFAGVRQLPPGHYLLAQQERIEIKPYWDMDYPPEQRPLGADPFSEQAHRLRHHLDEAVRLRLRADVPVCFHLSGGLDSTSVVALARRHLRQPPRCFTVGFGAAGYDELEMARHSAAYLGAELHAVPVSQDDLVECLSDAVYFSEGLAINGHLPAKYLLARAIHDAGFKVVLSGEGSDEILGGYAHLKQDFLASSADSAALADLRQRNTVMAGIHLPEGESLPLASVREQLGFVPTFLQAKATLGWRIQQVLRDDFRLRYTGRDPFSAFLACFDVQGQLLGRHAVDVSSYLWSKSSLATYILRTLGDGTEMACSIEGRLPFLDHGFFEYARELPATVKIHKGIEKFILREALADVLPEEVRRRGKHPFTAPPLSLFRSAGASAFLQDTLRGGGFAACPFFDPAKVLALLDRLESMDQREAVASDPVLMLALTACLLQERFGL